VDVPGDGDDVSFLLAEHRCGAIVEVGAEDLAALPAELNPVVVGRLIATPGVRLRGGAGIAASVAAVGCVAGDVAGVGGVADVGQVAGVGDIGGSGEVELLTAAVRESWSTSFAERIA